jgi:hypothetical protein
MTITLHFYNNNFDLENYSIAFEYLNEDESYSGDTSRNGLGCARVARALAIVLSRFSFWFSTLKIEF